MRESVRSLGLVVGTAFRADPRRATLAAILAPVVGLATAASSLSLKLVVDAVAEHRMWLALAAAALLAATFPLADIAGLVLATVRFRLQERTGLALERRLVRLAASVPSLELHERPDYLDRLQHLRAERSTLGQAIGAIVMSVSTILQVLATVALLASVHPMLLLLPVLGVPVLLTSARSAAVMDRAKHRTATMARLAAHYLGLATEVGSAKELRLFGSADEVRRRDLALGEAMVRARVRARFVGEVWEAGGSFVFVAGYVAAIAFVVWQVGRGAATPGDVLLTLRLAAQVSGGVANVAGMARWVREVLLVAGHFLWVVDRARPAAATPSPHPPVRRLDWGIALEEVTFRYPGTHTDVLRDVDLFLPAGTVVALVGENGAGKSTLVKLLCRYYQPTHGRIAVDGVNLADLAVEEWRAELSGAFQDFSKFEFIARESIGVGDLTGIGDPAKVREAAERAGASAVIDALPDGLTTQLGRTYGGVDLSQGQWQRLALARSRMRRAPLLHILDEPTASLDAASEHALFSHISDTARRAAESGAITLLVSHRLSTVRDADLIVVLSEGRVAEVGTHARLMATSGPYAELFSLQAEAYR